MIRTIILFLAVLAGVSLAHAEEPVKARNEPPSLACEIFRKRGDWYEAARRAEVRWGLPAAHQLALLTEEWDLKSGHLPPKWRPSWTHNRENLGLADGYFEATWNQYRFQTGNKSASQNNTRDVFDFTGWFLASMSSIHNISPKDPVAQYVIWRNGPDAYVSGQWQTQLWMRLQAEAFATRARYYDETLKACQADLDQKWSGRLSNIAKPWTWTLGAPKDRGSFGKPGISSHKPISSR